jgi:hypothetical protein
MALSVTAQVGTGADRKRKGTSRGHRGRGLCVPPSDNCAAAATRDGKTVEEDNLPSQWPAGRYFVDARQPVSRSSPRGERIQWHEGDLASRSAVVLQIAVSGPADGQGLAVR